MELPLGGLTLRPFEAWTNSPVGPAVVIAAGYGLASFFGGILIGGQAVGSVWFDILYGVIFAYVPAAVAILRRGVARDLFELRPMLRCSDAEFRGILKSATCISARQLAIYCGISVPVLALMPLYDPGFFKAGRPPLGDPLLQFVVLRHALLGWVGGYALASVIGTARTYKLVGRTQVNVDLLDTGPLHLFARQGMRTALAWILLSSLISLFWLDHAGQTNGVIIGLVILLVTASLVYGVSGVHDSIRREKSAQLATLRERIRTEHGVVIEEAGSRSSGGTQLAGLIAYHDLIERTPEWPFDASMVARLALFATLGLGSWLGGAVVERLLENWF